METRQRITFKQLFSGGDPVALQLGESAYIVAGRNDVSYYQSKVPSKFVEMLESVLPKIADEYCFIGVEDTLAYEKTLAKMWTYAVTACDAFIEILDYYDKAKGKLLQAVRVKEGASDMPQSATLDELEASANKNDLSRVRVQLSDGGTLMARIAEVQSLMRSTLEEWADDFIGRFVVYDGGGDGDE